MQRNVINKPKNIKCGICNTEFSAYSFPSHLKHKHDISSVEYVKNHGEFRKIKTVSRRKVNKISCKICNNEFSSIGMFTHLRDTHGITIDNYVKNHGEFRVNKLKKLNNVNSTLKCLECGDDILYSDTALSYHIKLHHNISKEDYIIKHILKSIPHCKCGCNKPVKILNYVYPYHRDFISGHNSNGNFNGMYGKKHDISSKLVMKEKAYQRITTMLKNDIILPWHTKESVIKRGKNYSNNMMGKKAKIYNIELLNNDLEQKNGIYKYKCLKCGNIYQQYHNSYFNCQKCHPRIRSKFENEIFEFLSNDLKLNVVKNYRKIFRGLYEIDLFLPDLNVGIEFDGLYWHSEMGGGKQRKYHINKTNICYDNNIRLIHVFEDDWLFKKDIVKSKIKHILNKSSGNKYYARKCIIKEVDSTIKNYFLDQNHIQGNDKSSINLGCYYNGLLVSVMTFSKPNITKGYKFKTDDIYELSRFATLKNDIGIGMFSKLFSYFTHEYNPKKVITYADLSWTSKNSNIYIKNGFTFVSITPPNYWYMNDYKNRLHRFNFAKHKLIKMGMNKNLSEWENMKNSGYDRIWDCGNLKYEWNAGNSSQN